MQNGGINRYEAVAGSPGVIHEPSVTLEPVGVPLGHIFTILRRHLWVVILSCLLGVVGTAVVVSRMAKQYTATTSILIEPQRTQVSDLQAISHDPGDIDSLVRTQIDILRSPSLQMNVVRAL